MEANASNPGLPGPIRRLLRDRIAHNLELPMQSQTAAQVISMSRNPDLEIRELTELIERDPALAGHILALANSSAYAAREEITSLQQAINWLGVSKLVEIAVAVSLKGKVFDVPGYATVIRDLWIHSAASAVYARELAEGRCKNPDGLFICGLLHDVGKPVVMQNLADLAREKTKQPVPKRMMELAMDEFHEFVGGMLVEHWEFPDWMIAVVRHHERYHLELDNPVEARVVHLASALAKWALDEDATEEDFDVDLEVIQELGLELGEVTALLQRRGAVLEVADAFM